jgi:hypothetical protein
MSGAYVVYGPFNNGGAPFVSKAFLDGVENFLVTLNSASYDSNITSDGSGNLTIPNTAHYEIAGFQIVWSPSSGDLYINCPNVGGSHKLFCQVGGVNKMSLDSSGNMRIAGSLTQNVTP